MAQMAGLANPLAVAIYIPLPALRPLVPPLIIPILWPPPWPCLHPGLGPDCASSLVISLGTGSAGAWPSSIAALTRVKNPVRFLTLQLESQKKWWIDWGRLDQARGWWRALSLPCSRSWKATCLAWHVTKVRCKFSFQQRRL